MKPHSFDHIASSYLYVHKRMQWLHSCCLHGLFISYVDVDDTKENAYTIAFPPGRGERPLYAEFSHICIRCCVRATNTTFDSFDLSNMSNN